MNIKLVKVLSCRICPQEGFTHPLWVCKSGTSWIAAVVNVFPAVTKEKRQWGLKVDVG